MDPLHATLEELVAEGYTNVSCQCLRCRMTRVRPMTWLPKSSMGLTRPLLSVKPWRQADELEKPQGRRG
jgi:hypothetical protein